jgi:hypothetical protein
MERRWVFCLQVEDAGGGYSMWGLKGWGRECERSISLSITLSHSLKKELLCKHTYTHITPTHANARPLAPTPTLGSSMAEKLETKTPVAGRRGQSVLMTCVIKRRE